MTSNFKPKLFYFFQYTSFHYNKWQECNILNFSTKGNINQESKHPPPCSFVETEAQTVAI